MDKEFHDEVIRKEIYPMLVDFFNQKLRPYICFPLTESVKLGIDTVRENGFDSINIAAVSIYAELTIIFNDDFIYWAIQDNDLLSIKQLYVHELRHFYQHYWVSQYDEIGETGFENEEILEKWKVEFGNYKRNTGNESKENTDYFEQLIEVDACAYSHALMTYLFPEESENLWLPETTREKILSEVPDYIGMFEELDRIRASRN